MNTLKRFAVWLLMGGLALAVAPPKHSEFLESFTFQGRSYSLFADFSPTKAGLRLAGRHSRDLSAGLLGENILLGTRSGNDHFYVFWIQYREKALHLACYDQGRDRSRVLPLAGFAFIGVPEIIEENGDLIGLVFLANRSDNDDIFYYEPDGDVLAQITRTPFSEKGFLAGKGRPAGNRSPCAAGRYRYRFDPRPEPAPGRKAFSPQGKRPSRTRLHSR